MSVVNPMMTPGQSVHTNEYVVPDARPNTVTRADMEEPVAESEVSPEAVATTEATTEGTDPVAENVEAVVENDAEGQAQADTHNVMAEDLVDVEAIKQSIAEMDEKYQADKQTYLEERLKVREAQERGEYDPSQAQALIDQIDMKKELLAEQHGAARSELVGEYKAAELEARKFTAQARQGWQSDPENAKYLQDQRVQAIFNNPTREQRALGLNTNPPAAVQYVMNQDLKAENKRLMDESERRLSQQVNNPALEMVGKNPSPPGSKSTQQTARFNPKTDNLVERLSRHFSA